MIRHIHLLSVLIAISFLCLLPPCLAGVLHQKPEAHAEPEAMPAADPLNAETEEETPGGLAFSLPGGEVLLNLSAEFNAEYVDVADLEDPRRDDSSDFFIGSLELTARAFFTDWSELKLVVSAEDFGVNGEEGRVVMSEAIVRLTTPTFPLYMIAGRTEMPFGRFEDRLIEGTLTEEVYEIDSVGLILGFAPEVWGADLSAAVYEAPAIIDNLEAFDLFEKAEGRPTDDRYNAFVAHLSLAPIEDLLHLSLFYNNEPGDGRRNQSIGAAVAVAVWRLSLDAEWISALTRERGENETENRESAWTAGLAIAVTDALELVGRYEDFDDDDSGGQDEVLADRWVAGGNCELGEWTTLTLEYRYSRFEKESGSAIEDRQQMVALQLAFEY